MKICPSHWDTLQQTLVDRGLGHLIRKEEENILERLLQEIDGQVPEVFDPLQVLAWIIYRQALAQYGFQLMYDELCPLCEVVKHKHAIEAWIADGVDVVYEYGQARGFVK